MIENIHLMKITWWRDSNISVGYNSKSSAAGVELPKGIFKLKWNNYYYCY